MSDRTRGILFVVGAAMLWSTGGLLIKLITLDAGASPIVRGMAIAGGRSVIAALAIWLYVRPMSLRFTRGQLLGAVTYAGTVICFVIATKMTTAANAILLQYTAPIYAALLSYRLLREPITRIDWGAIVLVLAGMGIFLMKDISGSGLAGDLFAIVSGIFFALCVVLLRKERHGSPMAIVLLGNIITALVGLPFMLGAPPGGIDLLLLVPLGALQLGLGYILFVRGVQQVSAIEGTLIPVMEPLLNPLWVALFYGEHPSLPAVIGGLIVIGTVTARGIYKAYSDRRAVPAR